MNIEYLESERKRQILTIKDFAERAENSTATYQKIIKTGSAYPTTIRKLIEALKLDPDLLMGKAPASE